jgi:hypothetical protein
MMNCPFLDANILEELDMVAPIDEWKEICVVLNDG